MDALTLLIAVFTVSGMSLTITKAQITAPFRSWVMARNVWFGELFNCFYCLSHWIAFAVAYGLVHDLILAVGLMFAFVAASAIVSGFAMNLLLWPEAETRKLRETIRELANDDRDTE